MINAPIPGESLTKPAKNYPWERPPEITDPEEAILMHISRLQDPDKMNAILDALELKAVDVYTLTKGIMRSATANGIHSIDVGLIAAPLVHEYIQMTAEAVGVEFDSGTDNTKQKETAKQKVASAKASRQLKEMGIAPKEVFERDDVVEEVSVEEVTEVEGPKGLASKPTEV